jgi:hypothetical protein
MTSVVKNSTQPLCFGEQLSASFNRKSVVKRAASGSAIRLWMQGAMELNHRANDTSWRIHKTPPKSLQEVKGWLG